MGLSPCPLKGKKAVSPSIPIGPLPGAVEHAGNPDGETLDSVGGNEGCVRNHECAGTRQPAGAAQLFQIELVQPPKAIGKNTIHTMQSGLVLGFAGLVEGLVRRLKGELGEDAKVIATGGLAEVIAPATDVIDVVDPQLTLRGLKLIHELNAT